MRTIALVGAGGKMGCRITDNIKHGPDKVHYLEVNPTGIERLRERGVRLSTPVEALRDADAVILAVPDVALEAVSKEMVPQLKSGALVLLLDPAAPLAGKVAHRDDLGYFIAHPCHPSVFNWEPTEQAFRDFYGGISAKQAAVCALMSGGEKYYELGVELTRLIYQPVLRIHRVTVEQMAMLEPALVETLAQTCIEIVKEGHDRIIAQGVPAAAARDFILGHLRIQIAVLFGEVNGTFSDAAYKISARARPVLFKEGWQRIFDMSDIREQVRDITVRKATARMKLGLSSYTYGWAVGVCGHEPPRPLDEHGLLDKCREHGVKLLQIGDNLPLHTFDAARLERFAERARHDDVQLEVGARRLTPERVAEYARIARQVGAKLVRFVIDDTDYHPAPKTVVALLRECAPLLDGLRLGIENHDRFPAATLREMIEATGNERIGVCLDTANSLGAGEGIEAVAAVLAPLTVNLHIKDFHIERAPHLMGFAVSGRPAGGGMLNLPVLLNKLAPFNRCQTAILELWTPPEPQLEQTIAKEAAWAVQSLEFLKPFFT